LSISNAYEPFLYLGKSISDTELGIPGDDHPDASSGKGVVRHKHALSRCLMIGLRKYYGEGFAGSLVLSASRNGRLEWEGLERFKKPIEESGDDERGE